MSSREEFQRIKQLFISACELAREDRAQYLEEACGPDEELRSCVEELLDAEQNSILNAPTTRAVSTGYAKTDTIDGYRLLTKIGDGGMGEVWEAEQEGEIRRRVAIKLIRWGMDSEEVVARFESERQSLAMMDHPNIAKVFEAGSTETGRPYFAMELVTGLPITEYCDAHRLDVSDRLKLFVQVCTAVQHAHQKGVIHRDIKPANILVTDSDGQAIPKIIDFGISKAINQMLTEHSVFTEFGQWIGTPEYMSPEQTTIPAQDVDTRADVYSLGVVLYELLVGTQPLNESDLREAGFDEMRRRIREQEPARPSTRAQTAAARPDIVASKRKTSVVGLVRSLRGDLDWLTMKALEKDRERRYATPVDLAREIERYLQHEPVLAGPPGGLYRARKFVRRHRIGVLAASFCVVALVTGLGLATIGLLRAKSSEREAIAQAESARRVSAVLEEIFNAMNPGSQAGQVVAAREVLQHGADRIAGSLHDQPAVRARLMATIGGVGVNLGYFEMADPLLVDALAVQRETLGNDHPDVGRTLFTIGWLAFWQGDHARSLASFEEAATILDTTANPTDQLPLTARTAAGFLMSLTGDIEGARETLDNALEASETAFGSDSAAVADVLLFSGNLHFDAGQFEEAGREWERAVSIRRVVFGADHQQYAFAICNLARYFQTTGQLEESKRLLDSAIEIFERTYGPDHPALADALASQGTTLRSLKDFDGAIRHYERAAAILKELFGSDHPNLSWITRGLAGVYWHMGELTKAAEIARESLRISEAAYGEGHMECARSHSLIGYVEYKLERYPESRRSYETSLAIRQDVLPKNHPGLATTCYNLACVSALDGDADRAIETLQMALDAGFASPLVFDDPDLESLRGRPDFEEMIREVERRIQVTPPE